MIFYVLLYLSMMFYLSVLLGTWLKVMRKTIEEAEQQMKDEADQWMTEPIKNFGI